MIPYGRHSVDEDDVQAVALAMRSGWLTQGPAVNEFEEALAAAVAADYAVVFSSGTAALHAATAVHGLGRGDRVAMPSLTFAATANCALYVGSSPVLVDVERETLNIDLAQIPSDVSAAIIVHYAGLPADLRALRSRPRVVIEDATHALGARTPDGPVGNCAHSDACVFSFHPVKAIAAGEGGAVTTNSQATARALRRFRSHGMEPDRDQGGWYYEIRELGFNYRLSDIQAALARSQLSKLERFIGSREALADRYRTGLSGTPAHLPAGAPPGFRHAYHLFPVRVANRRRVYEDLQKAGIGAQVHYVPLHHHPRFSSCERVQDLEVTDEAYGRLLSLPIFPDLSDSEQDHVIATMRALV